MSSLTHAQQVALSDHARRDRARTAVVGAAANAVIFAVWALVMALFSVTPAAMVFSFGAGALAGFALTKALEIRR